MPFSFFKKKPTGPPVRDLVWATAAAKKTGLKELMNEAPDRMVIGWFSDSIKTYQQFLRENNISAVIVPSRQVVSPQVSGKKIVFIEHYPLFSKELELWQNWKASEIVVLSSLDEPLFTHFGGERISGMLQKLGMQENEAIEHTLISKSLRNAQEKLATKVMIEHQAESATDWFRKNIAAE